MKQYTWYVNIMGHVQVYEGDINEGLMSDALTLEEAMKDQSIHHENMKQVFKKKYRGIYGLFNHEKTTSWVVDSVTVEERPQIKYWIHSDYAYAFFTCIEEPHHLYGESGVTPIDVSEFLD